MLKVVTDFLNNDASSARCTRLICLRPFVSLKCVLIASQAHKTGDLRYFQGSLIMKRFLMLKEQKNTVERSRTDF